MKKRTFFICLSIALLLIHTPVYASSQSTTNHSTINHVRITITDSPTPFDVEATSLQAASNTITKTKTAEYLSSDNKVLWSVSITATFTYDGTSARCISYTPNATAYTSNWSIKTVTASKSGASATANAIAIYKIETTLQECQKSVTISCTKNGTVY